MSKRPKTVDYLDSHVNVNDRLRALETGVHPVNHGLNYFDSWPRTEMTLVSGSGFNFPSSAAPRAAWQRRTGNVYFMGAVSANFATMSSDGVIFATIPDVAAPDQTMHQMVNLLVPPYVVMIMIRSNGEVVAFKPVGAASIVQDMYLDNVAFPADPT